MYFFHKRIDVMTALALLGRWVLGGLFIWAGLIKLSDPKAFARSVDAFGVVPEPALIPMALLLPLIELAAGWAVMWRWRGGLPAIAGLLILFMTVLGYAFSQHLDIDCGCFSLAEQRSHTSIRDALIRDLVMLTGVLGVGCLEYFINRAAKSSLQGGSPLTTSEREEKP